MRMRMKSMSARCLALVAVIGSLSIVSASQLTIDATTPARERQRNADVTHGGGVGRKVSLLVEIQPHGSSSDTKGSTEVEFLLTNSGKVDLVIPISPHPADLEPADPKAGYTLECISLRIAPVKNPGGMLSGGVDLYGRPEVTGTLITLAPGGSIRVLTLVALPSNSQTGASTEAFVGTALLTTEAIRAAGGKLFSDLQEIGSAFSRQFTLESISSLPGVPPSTHP
jgi:hypothetical protein